MWRCTPACAATALIVVRAGPIDPCRAMAASVMRWRVAAISTARFLSSYFRLGAISSAISV